MTLETYIKEKRKHKDILIMTHIVMGYPGYDDCHEMIAQMVRAGVDLVELQIPFTEPMADGPVILRANQKALDHGATLQRGFTFARDVAREFSIPFLFMSYANILYRYGMDAFAGQMEKLGIQGAIVPDLPPEESQAYLAAMAAHQRCPIYIFSPETPEARMQYIASHGSGFIYCLARKGVTGSTTTFSKDLDSYLAQCRQATDLPLAVGFGVRDKKDVAFLKSRADIAVIGSQTIQVAEARGVAAVGDFIASLT